MAARLSDAIKEQNVDTGFEAHPAILQGNEAIARFVLGGNATFTLENTTTGNRFTFKVRALEDRKGAVSHFVSLLNGSDNEADFAYLGQLYRTASTSPMARRAGSARTRPAPRRSRGWPNASWPTPRSPSKRASGMRAAAVAVDAS